MSWRTPCNYCTLKRYEKQYGKENLRIEKGPARVPALTKSPWVEVWLKEGDRERFLASFAALTDQCVC